MNEFVYNRHNSLVKKWKYFSSSSTYIEYSWIPSLNWSPKTTTLVYFVGYDGTLPNVPDRDKDFNLLCIVDCSGKQKRGSWYFGKKGAPSTLEFVKDFIEQLSLARVLDKSQLVFAGKGMGAHAALYFQQIFQSDLSIIHNPTTNLCDSDYKKRYEEEIFGNIFDDKAQHDFQNLIRFIKHNNKNASVLLTSDVEESSIFYREQILPLFQFRNVDLISTKQLMFSSMFRKIDEINRQNAEKEFQIKKYEFIENDFQLLPISIKLSSRPAFSFNEKFSFGEDPFNDRSWKFWFQNLSWLPSHLMELDETFRQNQFEKIFTTWLDYIQDSDNLGSEFFYHDHSLAYRAMNLLKCIPYATEYTLNALLEHIFDTGLLLCSPLEDNALSNHAYDQAIALFLIANQLPNSHFLKKTWGSISLSRLERELEYSFTNDGVHVENSPSYHHGMLTNIHKSLNMVLGITEHQTIRNYLDKLSNSVPFLSWIIRPDGKVPPIGDSEEKEVSTDLAKKINIRCFEEEKEGMEVFADGYAIWKSNNDQFHMTLKSSNRGRFHRHDDDCSITLWKNGHNLILDSGLLYYQERDNDRRQVRSARGHSGYEIPSKRALRDVFSEYAACSRVWKSGASEAKASLGMYGAYTAERTVNHFGNEVLVTDNFGQDTLAEGIRLNFIVLDYWTIEQKKEAVHFSHPNLGSWKILPKSGFISDKTEFFDVITSPLKNQKVKSKLICFHPNEITSELIIDYGGLENKDAIHPIPKSKISKFSIFGSCVTRDMARICKTETSLVEYRARTSLTGYGTPKLEESLGFVDELPGFRRSSVLKDLTKQPLDFKQIDFLIVDLIDERFDIHRKGDSLFSKSTYLDEVNGASVLKSEKAFPRGSDAHMKAFEKGVKNLISDCRIHNVTIILHQAKWAVEKIIDGSRLPYSDDEAFMDRIRKENEILEQMEQIFCSLLPNIERVSAPEKCLSNHEHKWGLQPFHYVDEYYHEIFSQYEQITTANNLRNVTVSHNSFGETNLTLPLDWTIDPFNNRNWRHNFNSLRWLKGMDLNIQEIIITDFYNFHLIDKIKNVYFNTRAADHTMTLRIEFLSRMYPLVSEVVREKISEIISSDVSTLMKESVYRIGHNHGLMADACILEVLELDFVNHSIHRENIVERGLSTLDKMFYQFGLTREHSLSYQLYNLNFAIDFLQKVDPTSANINIFKDFTFSFLQYFSYSKGYQFAIGESFRSINTNLVAKLYSAEQNRQIENFPTTILEDNQIYSNEEFVSSISSINKNNRLHFVMTNGHNSQVHKQNDNLSFCLAIDGIVVFDDAGYSDVGSKEQIEFLASSKAHTTVDVKGKKWCTNAAVTNCDLSIRQNSSTILINGTHDLINGHTVSRDINIAGSEISVYDRVSNLANSDTIIQRFILSPEMDISILGNTVSIICTKHGIDITLTGPPMSKINKINHGFYSDKLKQVDQSLNGFEIHSEGKLTEPISISIK